MKPGSLRIVSMHPESGWRGIDKYKPGDEELFFAQIERLERQGYNLWLYEMTDKGWTEF